MKKIIVLLIVVSLVSCTERIKLSKENHLQLFNLKGNFKQINYKYVQNEITDISYKPIGVANPRFYILGSVSEIDLSYVRAQSTFDNYYDNLFFDSYNILTRWV